MDFPTCPTQPRQWEELPEVFHDNVIVVETADLRGDWSQ